LPYYFISKIVPYFFFPPFFLPPFLFTGPQLPHPITLTSFNSLNYAELYAQLHLTRIAWFCVMFRVVPRIP
jgi:hypothetical protein